METVFFVVFFWLASIFASSVLYNKALKKLDTEKKAELIDKFAGFRNYSLLIMIVIIAIYFILLQKELVDSRTLTICYLITFIIYLAVVNYYTYSVLKKNNFDPGFIRGYLTTVIIRFTGFIVLFSFLMQNL